MHTITFTCEVITPMFLAGADGQTPEIRPASIKGALRFWWRAMNGDLELDVLKQKEAEIFGGSGEGQGRSKVTLRVNPLEFSTNRLRGSNDLKYLAYGSEDRNYIDVGSTFKVTITMTGKDEQCSNSLKEIQIAFSLLSYFGGLGAKSRNGYGAFASDNLIVFDEIKTLDFINNPKAKYTAFSNDCQFYITENEFDNWQDLLLEMVNIYKYFGRRKVQVDKRQHIGAPFRMKSPPDRHSKLFIMSAIKEDYSDRMKGIITFLPYEYLSKYPGLDINKLDRLQKDWALATKDFKKGIFNAKSPDDDYLLKALLD